MGLNLNTLARRMHNKLLVADNSACIIGGRNIQNIYFAADKDDIFIDNEVLAIGPLALQAANEFETYWEAPIVKYPKEISDERALMPLKELREVLFANEKELRNNDFVKEMHQRPFALSLKKEAIPLVYGKSQLYYDIPTKVVTSEEDSSTHLSTHIIPYIRSAKHSLKIINPYFIPNDKSIHFFEALRKRGVEISILTNSLATNDGIPVYSAYARYHKKLLRLGVHLYELNPKAFDYIYKHQKYRKGSIPRSSLHAKSMIIDDAIFIIGSANLDPRSIKLNTEVVTVIHSKELATIESAVFENAIQPQNVFRLALEKAPPKPCVATCIPQEKWRVVWIANEDGKEVRYYNDGDAGFWRRFGANISNYIPLEKYL